MIFLIILFIPVFSLHLFQLGEKLALCDDAVECHNKGI